MNLPNNIFSWFCPHTCPADKSFLYHREFPPQQVASWSDKPSDPDVPQHTIVGHTHPCQDTQSIQAQRSGCTAGWHHMSDLEVLQDPEFASVVGPTNSFLESK